MAQTQHRFYIYDILSHDGSVIYVGKGSGRRHLVSKAQRGGAASRIVEWFASEAKAYAAEVARIALIRPVMNLHKGGNGSKATKRAARKDRWEKTLSLIGSRKYAALLVLAAVRSIKNNGLNIDFDCSKVEAIREVAYG